MFAEPCRRGFEGEPGRPESPRAHRSARGEIFQQREGVLHEAIDDQAGARHPARGIPFPSGPARERYDLRDLHQNRGMRFLTLGVSQDDEEDRKSGV